MLNGHVRIILTFLHCLTPNVVDLACVYAISLGLNKVPSKLPFYSDESCTVLVLIKLTKFAIALRLRCGSCKLIFLHYFIICCQI